MSRILISACLMGARVRYDGRAKTLTDALLTRWQAEGRLVPLCPEVAAGLPTPRPPAEIASGATAAEVMDGTARIVTNRGADVTAAFVQGAEIALRTALAQGCAYALLTDASPSCGSLQVYAGHHDGTRIEGRGVVAEHLIRHGIAVFAPSQITDLAARLG